MKKIRNLLKSRMSATNVQRAWVFSGNPVSSLFLGYQVTLGFGWGTRDAPTEGQITIEAPFTVRSASESVVVDPQVRETLSPVLRLLHEPVEFVIVQAGGTLEIRFANGTVLTVPKNDDRFEKWNSSGSGELHDFNMLCSSHNVAPWG